MTTLATAPLPLLRIGEVAERLGLSTRTLRYYEQLGLVRPSGHSPGGSRRYGEDDVARVIHIRELQSVFGFDLDNIRQMLDAEDRLAELRNEYHRGVSGKRQAAILAECIAINERLQTLVRDKIARLHGVLDELQEKADRYTAFAAERGIAVPERAGAPRKVRPSGGSPRRS